MFQKSELPYGLSCIFICWPRAKRINTFFKKLVALYSQCAEIYQPFYNYSHSGTLPFKLTDLHSFRDFGLKFFYLLHVCVSLFARKKKSKYFESKMTN